MQKLSVCQLEKTYKNVDLQKEIKNNEHINKGSVAQKNGVRHL